MLHRNTLIAICAIFCAVAVGSGLLIARLSKQNAFIVQQTTGTDQATDSAGTELPVAALPTSTPVPTTAPILALGTADATATSRPAPTSLATTEATAPAATAAPAATTAPAATAAPTGGATTYIEYTVQKGDLLNSIAKKYNVTTKDILAINQISNADSLTVGQVLRIPKA